MFASGLRFAVFLFCCWLAQTRTVSAEQYDVYLLAGQSNMDGRGLVSELTPEQSQQFDDAIIFYRSVPHSSDGWQRLAPGFSVPPKYTGSLPSPSFGPELAFAREMHDASPRRKLALIKGSKGGTSLRVDWNPGARGEPDTQGPRYRDFTETIRLATETLAQRGDTFAIRGLLWHQGESDSKASAAVYQERLETLIARIRQDTGVADLPVVVGEVFDNGKRDSVRAAIRAVGTSTSKLGFVSSAGTSTSDEGTHFDAASQWLMGKRFAEAMRKIQAGDNPPPMSNKTEPSQGTRRATGKPNVLFIAIDDLNDWIGCLGGSPDAKTPHLDRFAARSVLFDNAHCQVALCNASRSSVLSGLYASTTNIYGNSSKNASDAYKNAKQMPVWFRDNGYRAACMGKIYHNDHGKKEYWDEIGPKTLRWGPEPPNGRQFTERFGNQAEDSLAWAALDIAPGEMPDEQIATWAKSQLDRQHDQPFFLALGFYKPHTPMTAPRRFFDLFDRQQLTLPAVLKNDLDDVPEIGRRWVLDRQPLIADDAVDQYSPTYRRELVHAYHACVALTDDCVGQVLDHLERSRHANNTIVVLWSDHGWHLGEKHHWRKWMPWEESTRSPLMVFVPGAKGNGSVCHQTVGLIDIYPTLAKLCGLKAPEQLQGQSFDELLNRPDSPWDRPALTSTTAGNHTVRSQRWRYIRYVDGSEELYDHDDDPNEWENLAAKPEFQNIKDEHARWIDKLTASETVEATEAEPNAALEERTSQPLIKDAPNTASTNDTRAATPNVILLMSDDKSDDLVGSAIGSARNTENRRY